MDVSGGLSLVQFVIEKLGSPIWAHIEALLGLESELDKLRQTMSTIEAVLLDVEVEERLHQAYRTYVERNKLQRLKEALYRADDLFDEITTLAHLNKLMPCNSNKVCNEVCLFFSCSNQFRSALTWSQEMKKISEMLDDIVKDHRYDIGSRHPAGFDAAKQMRINRETHSFVCEDDVMIGREDDKRKVIDMLLNTLVEQQDGFVVSIVGIGGLGKTTLAQHVYNDKKIVKKFPQRKWVCVSDAYDVKVIVGQILAAVNSEIKQDKLNLDQLQMKLRQEMDGKKYFLVLDDVWNEEPSKWHELRKVLIRGDERVSRILVTTRSKIVADVVESRWTHELKGLSDDESLILFNKMALKPEEHPVKQQLVDIGKEIVRKCANVPLAIRVVGSLLRGQDESKWENLKNTDLANIVQDESNGIITVLKISYNYLPFHLKSCFSYCAVFPKDYNIIKEDLICLWMAQGFIISSDGESFEDVGEEYFKQLLQRCFFQDVKRAKDTEEIVSCKMHDLIHDLAKEVAGTDILSCTYRPRCFNEKTRHVYMDGSTPEDVVGKLSNMQRMRTFLCTQVRYSSLKPFVGGLSNVKYLRVLRLNDFFGLKKLPSGIGELVHLRYLDLSYNIGLCVLPSSITNLYNLQTLKLRKCWDLKRLPRELGKLVNLRHLDIYGCDSLTHMLPGTNSMTFLLTMFVVRDDDELVFFPLLEKLKLENMAKLKGWWKPSSSESGVSDRIPQAPVLSELYVSRCPNLTTLFLGSSMNLKSCLPNLAKIEIQDCKRLEHLPMMSQLRHLKDLLLICLSEVEFMECSSSSNINSGDEDELVFFPSLENLTLMGMVKLKGWWKSSSESESEDSETPQSPKLSHLNIEGCPNLTTLFVGSSMNLKSCLPNLAKIKIRDCKRLEQLPLMSQLRHLKVLEYKGLSEVEYMEISINTSGVFFPSLEKLKLENMAKLKGWWKPSSSESGESDRIPQAPLLSELYVSDCPNLTTLFVGSSINSKSCLPNLVEIEIQKCERLKHLPLMSKLRYLKVLKLEDLGGLEYMESSSNNISGANDDELFMFPSLEKVKLTKLPKLKGWWKSSSVSESEESETPQAPKLTHLQIDGCPELTTFPLYPGLQQLYLEDFNEALGPLIRETTQQKEEERHGRLREVKIDNSAYLNSLPIRSFHHLSNLHIYDKKMEELKTGKVGEVFRSGRLSSLRSLEINYCWNLKSISGRGVWDHLTALESLSLQFLNKLELEDEDDVINNKSTEEGCIHNNNEESDAGEMPWRYLASTLRSLTLRELPKVVKLPKGIGCLSSLHSLHIEDCYNLKSLTPSIGGLSSLQSLFIWKCPKLKRMPEEMRHLTSLTKLDIRGCSPELTKECNNKTGANWSNIQHIPDIKLDMGL